MARDHRESVLGLATPAMARIAFVIARSGQSIVALALTQILLLAASERLSNTAVGLSNGCAPDSC